MNSDLAFTEWLLMIKSQSRPLDELWAQRNDQALKDALVAIKRAAGDALNMLEKNWE